MVDKEISYLKGKTSANRKKKKSIQVKCKTYEKFENKKKKQIYHTKRACFLLEKKKEVRVC